VNKRAIIVWLPLLAKEVVSDAPHFSEYLIKIRKFAAITHEERGAARKNPRTAARGRTSFDTWLEKSAP